MVANRNALAAEKAEKATTYLAYLAKSEKRRRENQPSSLSFAIAFARTRARFAVVVDLLPASGCEWGVPPTFGMRVDAVYCGELRCGGWIEWIGDVIFLLCPPLVTAVEKG